MRYGVSKDYHTSVASSHIDELISCLPEADGEDISYNNRLIETDISIAENTIQPIKDALFKNGNIGRLVCLPSNQWDTLVGIWLRKLLEDDYKASF